MSTPSPSLGRICMRAMRWRLSALSSHTMSVSKWLNCCSLVSGTTSARVSQFLLGCSLSKPVRYCRRVSALGPWVKCTRSGTKNSASSGRGARGACGNRARFWVLRLIRLGYRSFTGPDKVVLAQCRIKTVAMESTGVYWIPVYEILEQRGFEVLLVNARDVHNV